MISNLRCFFAGFEIQLIFEKVGAECACLTSTPPSRGAKGERSGSDLAVTCTGTHRGRRIARRDPRRGSRCRAGAARSGTTRSFFHFHVSKFIPGGQFSGRSGSACKARQPVSTCPTLVRLLGCGPAGSFDLPAAFEPPAGHRPPVARKDRPSASMGRCGGAINPRIVIGMRERGGEQRALPRARDSESHGLHFYDFCKHCPPHISACRGGGRRTARHSRSRGRRCRDRSRSVVALRAGSHWPRPYRR
jgi:hypothetical protein